MKQYPFLSLKQTLLLLRIAIAIIFLAHALVRIGYGTIPRFAEFLTGKGLPFATALVWGITVYEIGGSILLTLGYYTRWVTAGFIGLLLIGIGLIHAERGWFVGEHGTGGCEYSFLLIVALLVVAADKRANTSPAG
ncbi:MAG: DoxX family protein [Chitinophaga sp.]|uniref:DoxX family protein n=1 Tax=Chitinophaga sp. TaxID=1869181 RepID=UPI001B2101E3|nr:DoxX family protein [Chitinophaga sp.]MBO9732495.1 DoxX family protein [Chitinophaga sp.]